jgi:CheY-like chemotaxis protein
MEREPDKRVLVVEDAVSWQGLIGDLLQEVASVNGWTIQAMIASRFGEALNCIATMSFDCITLDNELQGGIMAKTLLDRIAHRDQRVPVIVVSGTANPQDVRDYFKDYGVEEFFWKKDFEPQKFKQMLTKLLGKRGDNIPMAEWLVILKGAAEIAAAAKTLIGFAGDIYQWFENMVGHSGDQRARKVWEDFKRDPEGNKDALARVAADLEPDGDPVLRGYVLGIAKQKLQANRAQIYSLLSGPRYTFEQVQDLCARMDPSTPGLAKNPSKLDLSQWAVNFAGTQETRWNALISNMLEVNPEVISDAVKLA